MDMKRGLIIGGVVLLILIILGIGINRVGFSPGENCADAGKQVSKVYTDEYPEACCEGLVEWDSGFDTSISVADECYETGLASGNPVGTCINCGNNICENIENPCNCPGDCVGKGRSDHLTNQNFCNEDYEYYCENDFLDLPLCDLCGEDPVPDCSDECSVLDEKVCIDGTSYKTCGDYDQDDCLEYNKGADCEDNKICRNGKCIASPSPECEDECFNVGEWMCSDGGNSYYTCGNYDGDNCLEWSESKECESGEFDCQSGKCIPDEPNNWIYIIIGIIVIIAVILLIILVVILRR